MKLAYYLSLIKDFILVGTESLFKTFCKIR